MQITSSPEETSKDTKNSDIPSEKKLKKNTNNRPYLSTFEGFFNYFRFYFINTTIIKAIRHGYLEHTHTINEIWDIENTVIAFLLL